MSNIKFVLSCSKFAPFSKIQKLANSHKLKPLTQYSFELNNQIFGATIRFPEGLEMCTPLKTQIFMCRQPDDQGCIGYSSKNYG